MDFDALRTATLAFIETHKGWAPLIVGVIAFCESLAFLSLLVPATVLLLGIGTVIGATDLPFWPIVAAASLGAILGDWVSYEVGRHFEERAHGVWPLNRYPEMVARGEVFLKRWGAAAVAVGRFIGPARAVVPLLAGIFRVPRLPFQVANVVSAIAWAFLMLAPGAGLLEWLRS